MSGDEDFFSVARTMPFVAEYVRSWNLPYHRLSNVPFMPKEVTP